MNWLLSAALDGNVQALQMKINNSSPDALQNALDEIVDVDGFAGNAIHLIAKLFDGDGFIELIDKLPADILNRYVPKTNSWNMTALHCAVVFQKRPEGVLMLLNKLNPEVLNQCLAIQDNFHFTGFMAALIYQQPEVIQQIFTDHARSSYLKTLLCAEQNKNSQFNITMDRAPEDVKIRVLDWIDEPELEQALRSENVAHWNGFHFAVLQQSDAIHQKLLSKVSNKLISEFATRTNDDKNNFLHFLLQDANAKTILDFFEKISPHALAAAVTQLDSKNVTPFEVAIVNPDEKILWRLLELLSNEQLNRIFSVNSSNGYNCLEVLCRYKTEPLINAVVDRLNEASLYKALSAENDANYTVLKTTAIRFSSEMLNKLLEKANSSIINTELVTRIRDDQYDGWNLLNLIATSHQADVLMKVIDKASDQAIEFAVSSACTNGNAYGFNALYQVANLQNDGVLVNLFNRISDETLNEAILAVNKFGWTPLLNYTYYFSEDLMLYLVARLSTDTIDKALVSAISNIEHRGTNLLHQLLFTQTFAVIKAFCEKASQEALEESFLMQLQYGDRMHQNALMLMSHNNDNNVIEYFLNRIPKELIGQAAMVRTPNGATSLHYTARFLRGESVLHLVDCLTDAQFNELITSPGDMFETHNITPFSLIFGGHMQSVCTAILSRMNKQSLQDAVAVKPNAPYSPLIMILASFDYQIIKSVLNNISDQALTEALRASSQHYYQVVVANSALTPETGPLVLQELQQRTGF